LSKVVLAIQAAVKGARIQTLPLGHDNLYMPRSCNGQAEGKADSNLVIRDDGKTLPSWRASWPTTHTIWLKAAIWGLKLRGG